MQVVWCSKNGYTILCVLERIGALSSAAELKPHLEEAMRVGRKHIALEFTRDSVLLSRFFPLLRECAVRVSATGGSLSIIAPNGQILEMLRVFGGDEALSVVSSEEELFSRNAVA
jgi:hypothetical protein